MSRGRILIIDDQPSARAWAREILRADFECFEAATVQQFFEIAAREQPDVVLADLEMGALNGLKLCKMVKANPALASIPFVLLTARESQEDRNASLASGADDHIPKSVSPRELVDRVRATMRLRGVLVRVANLERQLARRTEELRATTEQLSVETARRESAEADLVRARAGATKGRKRDTLEPTAPHPTSARAKREESEHTEPHLRTVRPERDESEHTEPHLGTASPAWDEREPVEPRDGSTRSMRDAHEPTERQLVRPKEDAPERTKPRLKTR